MKAGLREDWVPIWQFVWVLLSNAHQAWWAYYCRHQQKIKRRLITILLISLSLSTEFRLGRSGSVECILGLELEARGCQLSSTLWMRWENICPWEACDCSIIAGQSTNISGNHVERCICFYNYERVAIVARTVCFGKRCHWQIATKVKLPGFFFVFLFFWYSFKLNI